MKYGRSMVFMLIVTLLLLFVAWYSLETMVHGTPPITLESLYGKFLTLVWKLRSLIPPDIIKRLPLQ